MTTDKAGKPPSTALANSQHDEPSAGPMIRNSVLARTSRPPRMRVSPWLAWIFLALAFAVGVAAVGYWSYRLMQPTSLYLPTSNAPPSAGR
jgi:hypothetical protein